MTRMNFLLAHRGPKFSRTLKLGGAMGNWAHLRVEVMLTRELKYKEMKSTGLIPEIPGATHGDYDPRVLDSPLQKLVAPVDLQRSKQ